MKYYLVILGIFIFISCSSDEQRVESFVLTWTAVEFNIGEEFCDSKFIDDNLYCDNKGKFKYSHNYFGNLFQDFQNGYELKIEKFYLQEEGLLKRRIIARLIQENGQILEIEFEKVKDKIVLTSIVFKY
jgi:hypothetical protein